MKKNSLSETITLLGLVLCCVFPTAAQAHRPWFLPSATVLGGNAPWVTVDAAVSNDVFYFDHFPLVLDNLQVFGPDGKPRTAENQHKGRYRSTFDVKLSDRGTYKLSIFNDDLVVSYKDADNKPRRWRGKVDNFSKEVPASAKDVNVSRMQARVEAFVTSGKPNDAVMKPTGRGLELVPITHPNDLFAGEPAHFRFLLDGKPAAALEVTVIPGGVRYRDQLHDIKVKTDHEGKFTVTWPHAGMYWLNATYGGVSRTAATAQPTGTIKQPILRHMYNMTLEVLQP